MHSFEISQVIGDPLFKAGIVVQCLSAALIAAILIGIRFRWIDIIAIGLEGGIDQPSLRLEALYWGFLGVVFAFGAGFVLYGIAFYRMRKAQPKRGANLASLGGSR
jgi:hypothetical protein